MKRLADLLIIAAVAISAITAVALAAGVQPAAIIKLAATSCPFTGTIGWNGALIVPACGNVYVCTSRGMTYIYSAATGVLAIPGACKADRVFGAGFDR